MALMLRCLPSYRFNLFSMLTSNGFAQPSVYQDLRTSSSFKLGWFVTWFSLGGTNGSLGEVGKNLVSGLTFEETLVVLKVSLETVLRGADTYIDGVFQDFLEIRGAVAHA